MELEEKIYSNEEMAEWFEMSHAAFKNTKRKKLEELKEYADFEEIKGKIKITHIKDKDFVVYEKKSKAIETYVVAHIDEVWDKEGLETYARVAAKLCVNYYQGRKVENIEKKCRSFEYYVKKHRPLIDQQEWCKMYGALGKNANVYTRAKNIYEELTLKQKEEFYGEFYKRYRRDLVADSFIEINREFEKGEFDKDPAKLVEVVKKHREKMEMQETPVTGFLAEMTERFESDWLITGKRTVKEKKFEF